MTWVEEVREILRRAGWYDRTPEDIEEESKALAASLKRYGQEAGPALNAGLPGNWDDDDDDSLKPEVVYRHE